MITLSGARPGVGARQLKRGDLIGGSYRLLSLIGKGGMGYVFGAEHTLIKKQYALKILAPELLNDATRKRFEIEGRAIANLEHVNIVKVHNMGVDESDCPYYVMDLLAGQTLSDSIAGGALTVSDSLNILQQMARGLGYAHSKGIVHRDVKPANAILQIDDNDRILVKIVDFGIAKVQMASGSQQSQTATGEVVGSPLYMSPEQCMGNQIDARSDIYSLGCTFYEMITGVVPFHGANALETVIMHQNQAVPGVASQPGFARIAADCDYPAEALDVLIARMMAKRPADRYQTMQQVEHDLDRLRSGKLIGKGPEIALESASSVAERFAAEAGPGWSRARTATVGGIVTVGVLSAAALCYFVFIGQQAASPPASVTMVAEDVNDKSALSVAAVEPAGAKKPLLLPFKKPEPQFDPKLDDSNGFVFNALDKTLATDRDKANYSDEAKVAAAAKIHTPFTATIVPDPHLPGKKLRRFNFPDVCIADIVVDGKDFYQARGVVEIRDGFSEGLVIGSNRQSHLLLKYPAVFNRFDPHEFTNLGIISKMHAAIAGSFQDEVPDSVGVVKLLERALVWTKLKEIILKQTDFNAPVLAALEKLKAVESIEISHVDWRPDDVATSPFLQRMKSVCFMRQYDCGPVLKALASAPDLRVLRLTGCELKKSEIEPLTQSGITDFRIHNHLDLTDSSSDFTQDMQTTSSMTTDELIDIILRMKHLKVLHIGGVNLSAAQIKKLTLSRIAGISLDQKYFPTREREIYRVTEPKVVFVPEPRH